MNLEKQAKSVRFNYKVKEEGKDKQKGFSLTNVQNITKENLKSLRETLSKILISPVEKVRELESKEYVLNKEE